MTKGYCYLVSRYTAENQVDLSRVKIGFFSGNDLEYQIHNKPIESMSKKSEEKI